MEKVVKGATKIKVRMSYMTCNPNELALTLSQACSTQSQIRRDHPFSYQGRRSWCCRNIQNLAKPSPGFNLDNRIQELAGGTFDGTGG